MNTHGKALFETKPTSAFWNSSTQRMLSFFLVEMLKSTISVWSGKNELSVLLRLHVYVILHFGCETLYHIRTYKGKFARSFLEDFR